MSNRPTLSLYYDNQRIEPAPIITVEKEPIYANDSVIGWTYVVNLTGYASSVIYGGNIFSPGISTTLNHLSFIKNLLSRNGSDLYVTCHDTGGRYLEARGGHLKSFNTEPNDNQWINYIKYTASIEFSDLSFGSFGLSSVSIANDTLTTTNGIFAVELAKLKSYDDNWSFEIPENEAYLYYARITPLGEVNREDYSQINVSYTINATGKHFYVNGLTSTAWENAKNFAQLKLFHQINMFRQGGLLNQQPFINSSYNSNDIQNSSLNDAHTSVFFSPAFPPILDISIVNNYKVYDEFISCSTSESEGTFSATYNCILKRFDMSIAAPLNSIHNFTINYNETNDFTTSNRTITVNGSLQGLLPTNILQGFDNDGQTFVLPPNGVFFGIDRTNINTKYAFAWEDFRNFIANPTLDDLRPNFKSVLGINYASLFPDTNINSPCVNGYNALYQILALPKEFSINHNYTTGSIEYTATYDTDKSCAAERGFESVTITEEDSVPMYSETTVIGRSKGPILQNLNTNRAKTISISFNGVTRKACDQGNPFASGSALQTQVCDTDAYVFISPSVKLIFDQTELASRLLGSPLIEKSHDVNYDLAKGSYSVSKSYLVCPKPNKEC
jgi:hypothetical protein